MPQCAFAFKAFFVKCVEPTLFLLVYPPEFLFYWKCNIHDHHTFILVIDVSIGLLEDDSFR